MKDQNWEVALFQEMASTPSALEASRYCDFLSNFTGNTMEGRDVQQAYLQASMEGSPTHICLTKKLWADAMHKMRCPVVLLEKAFYCYKNVAFFGMKFCDQMLPKGEVHADLGQLAVCLLE